MAINRHIVGLIIRDIAAALAVLSMVFLALSHQPTFASPHDHDVVTAAVTSSFCGGDPVDTTHAPCHACRIAAPALPPPPCVAIDAPLAAEPVRYAAEILLPSSTATHETRRARAPPALA